MDSQQPYNISLNEQDLGISENSLNTSEKDIMSEQEFEDLPQIFHNYENNNPKEVEKHGYDDEHIDVEAWAKQAAIRQLVSSVHFTNEQVADLLVRVAIEEGDILTIIQDFIAEMK